MSALTLATNLPSEFRPVYAVIIKNGPLAIYMSDLGVSFLDLPAIPEYCVSNCIIELWRAFRYAVPLTIWLKKNDIQIVHTHEYDMNSLWPVACFLAGVKHVWHQRNYNDSRRMLFYEPFIAAYLTISQYCLDGLPKRIRNRTSVVDNPVLDPSNTKSGTTISFPQGMKGKKKVGFIGHLEEKKRILFFLEFIREYQLCAVQNQNVVFLVFGALNGPQAEIAQKKAEEIGVANCCYFMGVKTPIGPWLATLDLLVAPAKGEGLGRAVIEAQMMGVPVLASRDGGHLEIIKDGETGYLAKLDDLSDFVSKAQDILEKPSAHLNELRDNARKQAIKRFSVESHVKSVVEIYRAISSV